MYYDEVNRLVRERLEHAVSTHPDFDTIREGMSVIKEEYEELWDVVKTIKSTDRPQKSREIADETIDLIVVAIRFALNCVQSG